MKSFSLVPTSEGPRREFKITWGLRAGYGPSGRIYDLEEAIRAAHRWTRERDALTASWSGSNGPTEYKCVARCSAPDGEFPSDHHSDI